jgi:predicted Fe-Mo cluster-binding NifX family protein
MKIAVPVNDTFTFYHRNPFTAPKFAIYSIEGDRSHLTFSLSCVVDNPRNGINEGEFEESQIACDCDSKQCTNMHHVFEHYALLDAIGGCSYLLADHYCDNTSRALNKGGVKVFKIPPIIHRIDSAIKNFLIGASLASTFKHIHHAS